MSSSKGWLSARSKTGIAGALIGVGLIFYALGVGRRPTDTEPPAGAPAAQSQPKKPLRAWNMALGDVVVVAPELGFTVSPDTSEPGHVEHAKLLSRIEARLQNVRALYRQASEKDNALVGAMTLQLKVGAMGEVLSAKEIASRIADNEFKKAVVTEAANWSFDELVTDALTIECPLLFVREGMDITTVIEWEKSLFPLGTNVTAAPVPPRANPAPVNKRVAAHNPIQPGVKAAGDRSDRALAAQPGTADALYRMKYAGSLRRAPNFSAPPITRLGAGTKVAVVNNRGEWLEIRTADAEYAGFVRKEFVTPAEFGRKP